MRFLRTYGLFFGAVLIFSLLYWFRPGGLNGPRPAPVPAEGKSFSHETFDAVLKTVVLPDGAVNYAALRKNPEALDRYLGQLRATSPKNSPHRFKTPDERLAYYINAYNAFVLAGVRDHCPLSSVQDVASFGGFSWRLSFLAGEEEVTLSGLLERISEVRQGNPDVFLVLSRGAVSGPPLYPNAFTGEGLPAQLADAAQLALASPRLARREGQALKLSELFQWHEAEVGDLSAYLAKRAPALVAGTPDRQFVPFDWALDGRCASE